MKKKIQALACAAMLAVGGFNVWTAVGCANETELTLENVEAYGGWFSENFGNDEGNEYCTWGSVTHSISYDYNGNKVSEIAIHYCDKPSNTDDCRERDQCTEYIYYKSPYFTASNMNADSKNSCRNYKR